MKRLSLIIKDVECVLQRSKDDYAHAQLLIANSKVALARSQKTLDAVNTLQRRIERCLRR